MEKLQQYIFSNQFPYVYGALETLYVVVKSFEFVPPKNPKRNYLNDVVGTLFPILLKLFQNLVQLNSVEAANMMRFITKIFWTVIYVILHLFFKNILTIKIFFKKLVWNASLFTCRCQLF